MSVTHFLEGGTPEPWWHFTEQRKRQYGNLQPGTSDPPLAANNSFNPMPLRGTG